MKPTVLFVDDEPNILKSLGRELTDCSFSPVFASSASEAIEILNKNNICVVVTDLRMPVINGLDFLKQVKKSYPDIIRIILTGYADKESVINSINQGQVYYYIMKPCDIEELKIIVNKAIEYYITQEERTKLYSILFKEKIKIQNLNDNLNESLVEQANIIVEQKKKIEESYTKLMELSNLKRDIINLVSHELRTPLTIMMSSLELIEISEPSEKLQLLTNLKTGINRLNRIISDILTISLLKSPKQIYNMQIIEISSIIVLIYNELSGIVKQKKINFSISNSIAGCGIRINADRDKIIQALENILDNAFKNINENGTVILDLSVQNLNETEFVQIKIKDNGKGIPENKIEKIWEMFELAENLHNHHNGIGLGLPIAKKIIEDHKGKISVISAEKIGSEFTILLPVKKLE